MKAGTKSLLFGVHQALIHPWFVALAWWFLYGFPCDPRLWCAFFLHDLGYWGAPNMDGPEGEQHPRWAARVMTRLFGREWGDFCLYHSRFLAAQEGHAPSRLCLADKLAIVLTPFWLYLPLAHLSGEIAEYRRMGADDASKYKGLYKAQDDREWLRSIQDYLRAWVFAHLMDEGSP